MVYWLRYQARNWDTINSSLALSTKPARGLWASHIFSALARRHFWKYLSGKLQGLVQSVARNQYLCHEAQKTNKQTTKTRTRTTEDNSYWKWEGVGNLNYTHRCLKQATIIPLFISFVSWYHGAGCITGISLKMPIGLLMMNSHDESIPSKAAVPR